MMSALNRAGVALSCGAFVVLADSASAPTESLANAQFVLAPTMHLTRHLA